MPPFDVVLALLAVVAALAAVGRRVGVPSPIVFTLGGIALALVPGLPAVALPPDLVLVVFLPPLIFAAAQNTTWGEVRQNGRAILLLAVGLVLATMAAVAVVAHAALPGLSWGAAFTLGAVVAPPDAVAATAVADTLDLPRRLVAVLEGEGLFNDATALIAFQVASAVAVSGAAFALGPAALRLIYAAAAAVVVGLAVAWFGGLVLARVGDVSAETTVRLLLPFAAYLPAEAVHGSGVVAVIVFALTLNRQRGLVGSPRARLQSGALWGVLDFLLTGLSFVLVGLQLRSAVLGGAGRGVLGGGSGPPLRVLLAAALVCATVVVVRPVWVFATVTAIRRLSRSDAGDGALQATRPDGRALAVVSWAGMRGVVSLAVALSLPAVTAGGERFAARDFIVFTTFAVIVVTLVGQGLTLPAVIRRLGIGAAERRGEQDEVAVRLRLARTARGRLDAVASAMGTDPAGVDRVRALYDDRVGRLEAWQERLASAPGAGPDGAEVDGARAQVAAVLDVEQRELPRLAGDGSGGDDAVRRAQTALDVSRATRLA